MSVLFLNYVKLFCCYVEGGYSIIEPDKGQDSALWNFIYPEVLSLFSVQLNIRAHSNTFLLLKLTQLPYPNQHNENPGV